MSDNTGFYVVDWKNGFVGLFRKSNLEQYSNLWVGGLSAPGLLTHLKNYANMEGRGGCISIEFLDGGHDELNKLRAERGLEIKTLCL